MNINSGDEQAQVQKFYQMVSVWQLMNDLYLYDLGLPEKLVVGVKRIITNIMFRSIMLQYMRAITDYHNQMCG